MRDYKSEVTRANAVFKYFIFSFMATAVTFSCFTAVCAATDNLSVPTVLIIIALHQVSWFTMGVGMCAVFDSLGEHPPTPPKEKWKTVTQSNKVTGKTDVTEIVREKTYKL